MVRFLGDHWERSYGDLEWRGEAPGRTMPWYFMAYDGKHAHGYGVRTGPAAFCFWNADAQGISLWADVRSGGVPVALGNRTLEIADVVCRESKNGESAFKATQAFCHQMCPTPRLTAKPVYGTNDWNFAYGNNSAVLINNVSELIAELSQSSDNRPFSVIDEGWAEGPYRGKFGHGPWVGNPRFGDMAVLASKLKGMGVRPGLWFRPLTPLPDSPPSWLLSRDVQYLDPTVPEVHEHVAKHIQRFVGWGYEMIKHDFTTWDLLGLWGFEMGSSPTKDGWRLQDSSKTNAEVLTDLYRTIREAAGSAYLIGCNTVSHLAAGFHEIQRTGDDTSGRSWNRNRRMGVNTLAFRAPQHRAFYELDPDIVAITKAVPWDLVEQWLRLVSESGTSLFVAVEPTIVEPKHRLALRRAFDIASKVQPTGEPRDWMDTDCPRKWKLRGKNVEFDWMGETGAWPFGD
jgi:alpha-galactosidase